MDEKRRAYIAEIKAAKEQLKTAGEIHARDLTRQIHRMEKELQIYDYYRNRG
jgi:hypothetical protein